MKRSRPFPIFSWTFCATRTKLNDIKEDENLLESNGRKNKDEAVDDAISAALGHDDQLRDSGSEKRRQAD